MFHLEDLVFYSFSSFGNAVMLTLVNGVLLNVVFLNFELIEIWSGYKELVTKCY